jgi:hypothetical protein
MIIASYFSIIFQYQSSVLMFAARGGDPTMVELLVTEHGAAVKQQDKVFLLLLWLY